MDLGARKEGCSEMTTITLGTKSITKRSVEVAFLTIQPMVAITFDSSINAVTFISDHGQLPVISRCP